MDANCGVVGFVHELGPDDLPPEVLRQAQRCLLDLVGVAAAGTATELSAVVRGFAARHLGGQDSAARLLFDGRPVSQPGAALANAATIDAMDGHDGHRLTKGHAGAAVLPAALATLEPAAATVDDLLVALVVGYEVATRAGIALHATAADYHSSGAWNAIGAAAVAARALRLGPAATQHALGIAEYHGPRGPMMRGISHPTMVKDSSGWGAHAGVSAALLAEAGFTGAPAELLDGSADLDPAGWDDLGRCWRIMEQYFKPYPVCRWAHPAVEAALSIVNNHSIDRSTIRRVDVTTFDAAARLAAGIPDSTEVAQYSLPFPVALAVVHGDVPVELVARPERADDLVRQLALATTVTTSFELTSRFPAERIAEVTLVLDDQRRLSSGRTTAPGDPERPLSDQQLRAKFGSFAAPVLGRQRTDRLLAVLTGPTDRPLAELTGELTTSGPGPATRPPAGG